MDSISQLALGAALGDALLGRRLGRTAMVVGGALGTLPDLDVLVRYSDAIDSFTRHRGWSHSLFVLSALSVPLAVLLQRTIRPRGDRVSTSGMDATISYPHWLLTVWLILVTHAMLDAFTVYGTQLWWPLPVRPVAIGSVFIIEPMYTAPLLVALFLVWRAHRRSPDRVDRSRTIRLASPIALLISSSVLGLSLILQQHAEARARLQLERQGVEASRLLVAPFPLLVLWRFVALDGDRYLEGYYSLFDDDDEIRFVPLPRGNEVLDTLAEHAPAKRLDWFTGSLMAAEWRDDQLVLSDLRMGIEASYVFEFAVAERDETDGLILVESRAVPFEPNTPRFRQLLRRVLNESVVIDRGDRRQRGDEDRRG